MQYGTLWNSSRVCALAALAASLYVGRAQAQTQLVYSNDFETPNEMPMANCATLDARTIQMLYGKPSFSYQQTNTVETVLLSNYGPTNASNGLYALGMLSTVQDDLLALTFDAGDRAFLNVGFDLTALDVPGCGGPFGVARASMRLSLLDSPNGVFAFNQKVLDTVVVEGGDMFEAMVPHFVRVHAALHTAGSTDGHVSLMLDLLTSGYGSFDNLSITASNLANVEDRDIDTITDDVDNCPGVRNTDQANADLDLRGDACDPAPHDPGVCGDGDQNGVDDCAPTPPDAGSIVEPDAGLDATRDAQQDADSEPSAADAGPTEDDANSAPEGAADDDAGADEDETGPDEDEDDAGAPLKHDLEDGHDGCACNLSRGASAGSSWMLGAGLMLAFAWRRRRASRLVPAPGSARSAT